MNKVLDAELKMLFNNFGKVVANTLGNNLRSIVIYGSVALGDFRRGKGDIDFVCITERDLTDTEIAGIVKLHSDIREGSLGEIGIQLEGAYYTTPMMEDIKKGVGRGYYIGTSSKGWKEVSAPNSLNYVDILTILNFGIVIAGEQDLSYIKRPSDSEVKAELTNKLEDYIQWARKLEDVLFSIEAVYFAVRALNTIMTGDTLSKGQACKWFCAEFPQSKGKELVEYCSKFRYPLSASEQAEIDQGFIVGGAPLFLEEIYRYSKGL